MLSFKKNPKAPPIIPAIKINIIPKINSIKFNITSPEFVVAEDVVEFKDDNAPDVVPEPKLARAPAIPIIPKNKMPAINPINTKITKLKNPPFIDPSYTVLLPNNPVIMDPKNAIAKRTNSRYIKTDKVWERPLKRTPPTNKTNIETIIPRETANTFILLFIRLIIFSLPFKLEPHFLQNCASALLSKPHLVQSN